MLAGAPSSCTIGSRISVSVNVLWASTTANQRYQVQVLGFWGFNPCVFVFNRLQKAYIAMDGGNAATGVCYPYFLHGAGPNGGLSTSANSQTTIGTPVGCFSFVFESAFSN